MTPKQNLMAALFEGTPEWMPACVHIADANNLPGHLPGALLAEPLDYLKIIEFTGGDILYEINAVRAKTGENIERKTETQENTRITTLTTSKGALKEEVFSASVPTPIYDPLPEGHVLPGPIINTVHKSFFIKELPDYRVLKHYHESLDYEADHELIRRGQERVGNKGLCVLSGGPSSPLYALVASYAGLERLTFDLFDAPDELKSVMQAMTESACRWYRAAADSPCEVIRCTEDLDSKLVSPEWFRSYSIPALKEYAGICHGKGKKLMLHMCGHIKDFLPDIQLTGVDALHCLTSPPMGNTTPGEARGIMQNQMAAMLRINADLMLHGSKKQIDQAVKDILDDLGDWHKALIIIPCGRAPLANIRRVIEQVHKSRF